MGKDPNRHSLKKLYKWQISSISLAIRKMQIKSILKYYFTPTGMAKIKKTDNNK